MQLGNISKVVTTALLNKYSLRIRNINAESMKRKNKISLKGTMTLLILYLVILVLIWLATYLILINRGSII